MKKIKFLLLSFLITATVNQLQAQPIQFGKVDNVEIQKTMTAIVSKRCPGLIDSPTETINFSSQATATNLIDSDAYITSTMYNFLLKSSSDPVGYMNIILTQKHSVHSGSVQQINVELIHNVSEYCN